MFTKGLILLGSALPALAGPLAKRQGSSLAACPGYTASNVQDNGSTVTADLALAGAACNVYGDDIKNLKLQVEYQTGTSSSLVLWFKLLTSYRATLARQDL
jgi:alpha-glucosidase